ncbi:MAG: ABC transporter permease, partial [Bryobacteraceae bacterium]
MRVLTRLRLRLRSLLRRAHVDHELDAELRFHLDHQIAENLAAGMPAGDARNAALRTIGGIAQFKEECRDARRIQLIEDLARDLAYALRQMRRTPILAAAAIASLALGIGANTAIFSLIDAVLLRTLPVECPGRLVLLSAASRNGTRGSFSYADYQWIRDRNDVFSGVLASARFTADMTLDGRVRRVNAAVVSGNYFSVLGVRPAHGRLLTSTDDTPNAHAVAVISHGFWTRHFGPAHEVITRTLQVGGALIEVAGVAPPEFFGESIGSAPDLWVPSALQPQLMQAPSWLNTRNIGWLDLMARLKPGVGIETARSHLAALLPAVQADLRIDARNDYLSAILVEPGAGGFSRLRGRYSEPLHILMGAVAIVLLLACANASNLLIARAAVRRREFAVRLAIGAGRGRLVRQLFVESLLLGAVAGAFGLLLAPWTTKLLVSLIGGSPVEPSLNLRVLGFSAIVTLAAGFIFGMVPSLHAARIDPGPVLKLGGQMGGIRRWSAARLLVSAQVALSLSLLVGAGLFVHTLVNLQRSDPGFDRDNVLQVQLDPQAGGYKGLRSAALAASLRERIAKIQGVRSASVSAHGFSRG